MDFYENEYQTSSKCQKYKKTFRENAIQLIVPIRLSGKNIENF
jgi:hypothetical protein